MIENEGLEYFFLDYLSPSKILDSQLRDAVNQFTDARLDIQDILRESGVLL